MSYDLIAFITLSLLLVVMVPVLIRRPIPLAPSVVLATVLLRVVGSTARYEVNFRFYGGAGDAMRYFYNGLDSARKLWSFDLSPLGFQQWFGSGHWWGTPFMDNLSGLAVALVGPTLRGEFLLFSLASLLGIFWIAVAFYRSFSEQASVRYATWVFLWPSLWFWPSSVGKEAVTVFAIGLTTLGYAGRRGQPNWSLFLLGLAVAFAVRPHVTAVLALAAAAGHWLASWKQWTRRRVLESLLLLVVFLFALRGMTAFFGEDTRFQLQQMDIEGFSEFIGFWNQQTITGGSSIGAVPAGVLGSPIAFINVWMRPFIWEAHNLTALFSALEILFLWWLVWRNRTGLLVALKHWREIHLLRFALPLLLGYTLMVGFTFGNLGIIARQRTPMFPFFLMFLTCVPVDLTTRSSAGRS